VSILPPYRALYSFSFSCAAFSCAAFSCAAFSCADTLSSLALTFILATLQSNHSTVLSFHS